VRAAIASQLDPALARALHGRLARALLARGDADPETLAHHFQEAGDPRRAARYAARAGDRASAALAFDRAARNYQLALSLETGSPRRIQRLRVRLARTLGLLGRAREAADAYAQAAREGAHADAIELRRRAADQYLRAGRMSEALHHIDPVLADVGIALPRSRREATVKFVVELVRTRLRGVGYTRRDERDVPPELLRRIAVCNQLLPFAVDTLRGPAILMHNLRYALEAGVPRLLVAPLGTQAMLGAVLGQRHRARTDRMIATATQLADEVGDPYLIAATQAQAALADFFLGRYRSSVARADDASRLMAEHCVGTQWELGALAVCRTRSQYFLGDVVGIRRSIAAGLREAQARGDLYESTNLRVGLPMAISCLATDDVATARWHAEDAIREWSYDDAYVIWFAHLLGLIVLDLYEGEPTRARGRLDEMRRRFGVIHGRDGRLEWPRVNALFFRGAASLHAAARARGAARTELLADADTAARQLARMQVAWGSPLGALIAAGVAAGRGALDAARAHLELAERGLDAADLGLYAAAARRQRGRLLGGDQGAALIDGADAWMRAQTIHDPARFADLFAPGFVT